MSYLTYENISLPALWWPEAIGKTIESVWLSADKKRIMFAFADMTNMFLHADGDCCSYSWFESVELLDFKGQILSVEYGGREATEDESLNCGDTLLQIYFLTLKTNKGRCLIEMRNTSNGYYGGSFEVAEYSDEDIKDFKFMEVT